ncbi:MAG TPA: bifunctional oligoribonuclease/PAP phosphatase NrnA [Syntrophales bacterium]|jgi:phosphoesterase RecJ-like protein|nr:bifunctional oligoribonuclease/PAP phosphatase NrnA [Syntrophales bacterium]HON22360.1 bifunctional oligoribonuclease/PAP phosphatase NrnA [Syntrophales bacterium]HOU77798.1 bifunctional oligoribonuclease/PAP phosphatase NrnA [Syntrophales bacterium]HPC32985.1 bifunctional oligoribonuclease/PAP phosphatase NrnA [Syntrophales bacterium]HQG34395.1 bifunctional oligoribonuclease/PAP phosphatase NrnA [Syntrophales bacterium]
MLQKIIEILNHRERFLITAHIKLDGDALGSELALHGLLKNMGKEAVVYNQDPTPRNYLFLPGAADIVHHLPPPEGFDAVFVLDCSDLERVGDEAARIGTVRQIVNIDHHVSNGGFCELRLIDPAASSTGELIFRLLTAMDAEIDPGMATNLYTAILTDTGGFRYGNTGRDALTAAGSLVARGANPQWISENIYERFPLAKILLMAKVMQSLSFDCGGRVGSLTVMRRDFEETGALPEHTEGFVDLPRTIEGVIISILFTEMPDNRFKVSMRSKGATDVAAVAAAFGGGGHVNAAACRIEGDIATVKRRLFDALCLPDEK